METAFWQVAGEEWDENEIESRNFGKENGGRFSCSYNRVGRAGKVLVFFYSVKGIWLVI